jgi:hypothetical protein
VAKASKRALGADLVIPALALGFAAYFFVSIEGLAWEAKANGALIGTALVLLCAVQVGRIAFALFKGQGSLGLDSLVTPREVFLKRLAMVAVAVGFIVGMEWLGLTLALFLAMLAALYAMGVRRPLPLVLTPLACAAAVYVMFILVLNAEFPHGPVERLLGAMF